MSAVDLPDTQSLPDDVAALKALVAAQCEQIGVQSAQLIAQRARITMLEHNVEVFRKLAFGASSERRRDARSDSEIVGQGHLFEVELMEEAQRNAERLRVEGTIEEIRPATPPRKKGGGRRKTFPEHCPVFRTTYGLSEGDRTCACGSALHEVGEDVRRELERIETTIVHEIACKKYACRACERGVRTAPGPERVIEKGILGKGFLAHVVVERFQNHMPYYRLEKKYASEGLELGRSVLQRSMARVAELLEPIWRQLRKEVLASPILHTDDTPIVIAQARDGARREGRAWVYVDLEDRNYYECTESRGRDAPAAMLSDYEGFVHADAYAGYDQIFRDGKAVEIGCWSHGRRYFIVAESSDPILAKEALDRIGELFRIEREIKDCDAETKRAHRQAHARPRLDELRSWMEATSSKILPKSPMASAIRYVQNQWDALTRYVDDGRLKIDNNAAERALRPFAVGRKNWLFFQQESGSKTAAVLASLLQTAKAIGLNPQTYFRDVLTRIATCSEVEKLTPHGWKAHFAAEAEQRARRAHAAVFESA